MNMQFFQGNEGIFSPLSSTVELGWGYRITLGPLRSSEPQGASLAGEGGTPTRKCSNNFSLFQKVSQHHTRVRKGEDIPSPAWEPSGTWLPGNMTHEITIHSITGSMMRTQGL